MKRLVPIPHEHATLLKHHRETGIGYHVVSVTLKNGKHFDQVITSEGCVATTGKTMARKACSSRTMRTNGGNSGIVSAGSSFPAGERRIASSSVRQAMTSMPH